MITMLHLLGIDAGGTSTRAMVVRADGQCLGVGRGGRGNPVSDGVEAAAASIGQAVAGALERWGGAEPISGVALAIAGGSVAGGPSWLSPTLAALGVDAEIRVEPDLLAMFASGTHEPDGYGLVAGTGATAVRVRDGEVDATADGLGWLIGDSGSGFWIGHQVARAVAADLDGRGPSTSLTPAVLDALGITVEGPLVQGRVPALARLVSAVYGASPLRLAALAPLAFADPADEVADAIVTAAEEALAQAVLDVAEPGLRGPLVIGGGVATQARIREAVTTRVRAGGVDGEIHLVDDGLVGAGVLALRRAGVAPDAETFARLRDTTAAARQLG
ncbi:N-acetylglucosamine kinase [Actinotalea caeni]|uniref:N-acetylglucosamine kinase n=1 Tax=Actinotalea caeni TaxID=1348467 RepID=UPI001391A12E|nr:BadF/BadG/BcrA/BcrD ATPase family protein [Actinotalea caeni]